jgi:hypothetical protein
LTEPVRVHRRRIRQHDESLRESGRRGNPPEAHARSENLAEAIHAHDATIDVHRQERWDERLGIAASKVRGCGVHVVLVVLEEVIRVVLAARW